MQEKEKLLHFTLFLHFHPLKMTDRKLKLAEVSRGLTPHVGDNAEGLNSLCVSSYGMGRHTNRKTKRSFPYFFLLPFLIPESCNIFFPPKHLSH